jgi:subtilisin family serine protease
MVLILALLFSFNLIAAENRIKIAIIDTGIAGYQTEYLCENGLRTMVGDDGLDRSGHGTNIASIITQHLDFKKYCIISYKVYYKGNIQDTRVAASVLDAIAAGAKYINMSFSGSDSSPFEKLAIRLAVEKGINVYVAAGNDGKNLDVFCNVYPACYKFGVGQEFFHVVAASDLKGSNTADFMLKVEGSKLGNPEMSGSSQATANALQYSITNKYFKRETKHGLPFH